VLAKLLGGIRSCLMARKDEKRNLSCINHRTIMENLGPFRKLQRKTSSIMGLQHPNTDKVIPPTQKSKHEKQK
jgi:hypothetical protein